MDNAAYAIRRVARSLSIFDQASWLSLLITSFCLSILK